MMKITIPDYIEELVLKMIELEQMDWQCGTLHIAVCDGNMDDESIDFCTEEYWKCFNKDFSNERYKFITPKQLELEKSILDDLIMATEGARHMAYWICNNPDMIVVGEC